MFSTAWRTPSALGPPCHVAHEVSLSRTSAFHSQHRLANYYSRSSAQVGVWPGVSGMPCGRELGAKKPTVLACEIGS